MGGTYIENYERNLIENAFNEGYKEGFEIGHKIGHKIGIKIGIKEVKNDLAVKMKDDGVNSEFIFKYCGIWV